MKRFGSGGTPRFRFMEGRYGADELGRFLSISGWVIWCYSRVLSRNVTRRREENQKYLARRIGVEDWFALKRTCFDQRREYAFFRCPGCGKTVRVPKGKGRLRITCRHC